MRELRTEAAINAEARREFKRLRAHLPMRPYIMYGIAALAAAGWGLAWLKDPQAAKSMSMFAVGSIGIALWEARSVSRYAKTEANRIRSERRTRMPAKTFSHAG